MNSPNSNHRKNLTTDQIQRIQKKLGPLGFNITDNCDNEDKTLDGIGIEFLDQGDWCRAAVLLPEGPSTEDIKEAVSLLLTARLYPDLPGITVVRGASCLTGNEMKVKSLFPETTNPEQP